MLLLLQHVRLLEFARFLGLQLRGEGVLRSAASNELLASSGFEVLWIPRPTHVLLDYAGHPATHPLQLCRDIVCVAG